MAIFDRRYELMPRGELEQLQLERFQALLARLRRSVRRYREALGDLHVESLSDVHALPTTTPEDLAGSFPFGMFALLSARLSVSIPPSAPKAVPL